MSSVPPSALRNPQTVLTMTCSIFLSAWPVCMFQRAVDLNSTVCDSPTASRSPASVRASARPLSLPQAGEPVTDDLGDQVTPSLEERRVVELLPANGQRVPVRSGA